MGDLKIDDKVLVSRRSMTKGATGVITRIHHYADRDTIYIVDIGSESIKCLRQHLTLIQEVTGDSVTITREQFEEKVKTVLNPENFRDEFEDDTPLFISQCGRVVCDMLAELIFKND